ncbi:DNA polymerase IV [Reichenbachiella agariperforans]|uniref:DNA polymerase IV n=1 Tax=Reichenbachiella agariperforans TaxID=156994 RepID=UPI001C08D66A|nr:DNA polymerase IV [Reichenbachiella agariperforans]MBU2916036.1 DNA polymerase IV [Reichenbachiella agariperforans]
MAHEKSIVHMDLDTFFVSCERLHDKRLHNKPVLIGGTSDRGVVASCSYEARTFGVHSAMPMKLARQLCPESIIIKGNAATYSQKSKEVTEIIRESVPLFEKSSIDEFYMDLTGMDRFFGCMQIASELRQRIIKETKLPISFGLSENKTVSKIATGEAKPNNQMQINYGQEKHFLAPLSVKKIPMVGEKTYHTLQQLGIRYISHLQQMPLDLVESAFGRHGTKMWQKAQGIDPSPVVPYQERKSISTERTFDKDTTDISKLKSIMLAMAENLAFQLRRGQKLTSCVTVKIRYSDFNTHSLQSKISFTSADHILIPKIMELFDRLYNKRLLIRLIGVRFSQLAEGNYQIHLFEDTEEMIRLYQALDNIRDKHGDRKILRAAGIEAKTISRFNPFSGEPPPLLPNRRS